MGNHWVEIDLGTYRTTKIVGKNGHGKSTLLDALCYVQFGKAFRKDGTGPSARPLQNPKLINAINNKECVVELFAEESGSDYLIRRGKKPDVFEIYKDGVLIPQGSGALLYQDWLETHVLKKNYKSFTQVEILGAASFIPFMQLTAADRRAVIEDILDIQVFSSMNKLLKQQMDGTKEQLIENKKNQQSNAMLLSSSKRILDTLKNNNESKIQEYEEEIKALDEMNSHMRDLVLKLENHITTIQKQLEPEIETKYQRKLNKLIGLSAKLTENRRTLTKEIAFYSANDSCPTCKQTIEESFRETSVKEKTTKEQKIAEGLQEIAVNMANTENDLYKIREKFKKISDTRNEIKGYLIQTKQNEKKILDFRKKISDTKNDKGKIGAEEAVLAEALATEKRLRTEYEELLIEKNYLDVSSLLLKDSGIKSSIIKQYIPVLNKVINKYLAQMEFFCNFTLDENFEEFIKSRYRDDFSYANFSEGQKLRINLSIMFALREVARMKNSITTNLLIMDEILDSSLDKDGIEILLSIFNSFEKTNILIISHRDAILEEEFDRILKFRQRGNFNEIETQDGK